MDGNRGYRVSRCRNARVFSQRRARSTGSKLTGRRFVCPLQARRVLGCPDLSEWKGWGIALVRMSAFPTLCCAKNGAPTLQAARY